MIQARISTIDQLKKAIHGGAPEVSVVHKIIKRDPWIIDPRWQLLGDEVDVAKINELTRLYKPEIDPESGMRMDFLFVLQPKAPAKIDEVVVVEIKRGTNKDGSERHVNADEILKFQRYVSAVKSHYSRGTERPRIHGLMIAQGYTEEAENLRADIEQIPNPSMNSRHGIE